MEICLICNKQLASKKGLANHLHAIHSLSSQEYKLQYLGIGKEILVEGKDFIKCFVCGEHFRTLKKHLMVAHGYSSEEAVRYSISCSSYKEKACVASSLGAKARHEKYSDRSSFKNEEQRLQAVRKICQNLEFSEKMSLIMKSNWLNPYYRKTTSEAIQKASNQEELKQWRSSLFNNIEYRRKCLNRNNSIIVKDSLGGEYILRSKWEVSVFNWLIQNQVEFEYEFLSISYLYENAKHLYIPDFYIPRLNLILEVHPAIRWDSKMQAKQSACLAEGYFFEPLDKKDITDLKLTNLLSFYQDLLYADNISVASSYGKRMTNSDFYSACKITQAPDVVKTEVVNP